MRTGTSRCLFRVWLAAASSPLTAVLADAHLDLHDLPQELHPARHSWLWRVSKLMRSWEQRWFCLDEGGFIYAKSPQVRPVHLGRMSTCGWRWQLRQHFQA